MAPRKTDLPAETLELPILPGPNSGPRRGFDRGETIHAASREILDFEKGAWNPALHRREAKGWMAWEWGQSGKGRPAILYPLKKAGRKPLGDEQRIWGRMALAIGDVLKNA